MLVLVFRKSIFGLAPDMGGTQRLPRLVGTGQAKRMILACEEIDAREAREIGLVEIVVPREELYTRAEKLARRITEKPPWAVRFGKKAINASQDSSIAGGLLLNKSSQLSVVIPRIKKKQSKAFLRKENRVSMISRLSGGAG